MQVGKKAPTKNQCEKSPTNPFQDLSMLGWQACVLLQAVWGIKVASWVLVCSCKSRIYSGSWKQDWSYAMENSDSWGKAVQEAKERKVPFTWESSWSARSTASGWMRNDTEKEQFYGLGLRRHQARSHRKLSSLASKLLQFSTLKSN